MRRPSSIAGWLFALLPFLTSVPAIAQVRPEIFPIETVTLSNQQILRGDLKSKPVFIAGELRIPPGTRRVPAVILIHGSAGLSVGNERWAQEFNRIGVAAFLVDSFTGRGIKNTLADQSQVDSLAMMVDAYRALGVLARHSQIDANWVAIMGFSKGGTAAVYAANERFRKLLAPPSVRFAAHIGMYAPCNVTYRDDDKLTGAPIRFYHGTADDYVPVAPCRDYVERLKKAGADVALTEYPGAYHAYDMSFRPNVVALPDAITSRNCRLREVEQGVLVNSKTGTPFVSTDPCIERGPHVGYNEAAAIATTKAIKEFLTAQFKLSY